MKKIFLLAASLLAVASCQKESGYKYKGEGFPELKSVEVASSANFGDSLLVAASVADNSVPLSTIKATLRYGAVEVSQETIRTKENGDYSFNILVPFIKNNPEGTAELEIISTNIGNVTDTVYKPVAITYADYSDISLVLEDGSELAMAQVDGTTKYTVNSTFAQKFKAKVVAQPTTANGNEISWGMSSGEVVPFGADYISFSNLAAGDYDVTVDIKTGEFSPFVDMRFGGESLEIAGDDLYQVDLNVSQGEILETKDIIGLESLFVDEDYLTASGESSFEFTAVSGVYRFFVNLKNQSITVKRLTAIDGDHEVLSESGSGAIWVLGYNLGKPSCDYQPGWNPGSGYCVAEVSPKVFHVTVTAGTKTEGSTPNGITLQRDWLDFKFFHQDGWGGEFTTDNAEFDFSGEPKMTNNGGNINLVDASAAPLEEGARYRFIIDLSDNYPVNKAKISVQKLN